MKLRNLRHLALLSMIVPLMGCGGNKTDQTNTAQTNTEEYAAEEGQSVVYFIEDITPENINKIYDALGRKAEGEKIAVKLSTGEPGNNNYLNPNLIGPFVKSLGNATIVECNTAYAGGRNNTEAHLKAAEDHGFTAIAPVQIMDAEGEVELPIEGGKHLKADLVGKAYPEYDFTVVLSHAKGHPMGGFGNALKNISIGIASSNGKARIHSAGTTDDPAVVWGQLPEQDVFLECMAEAAKAITDHAGDKILYISVVNNLSVDCDCVADPEPVQMADIGILASLDPVAIDRAFVDLIYNSEDHGKVHMIERIESRNGTHILDYAEELGIGTQNYKLVKLD